MVDIARPDLPVARRRRRLILIGAGIALLALLGYGASRLPPAVSSASACGPAPA